MRNKKYFALVFTILLPAIFFTGCGGPKALKAVENPNIVEGAKSDDMVAENDTSDPIVESIKIEPYGGNIGDPNDFLYGEVSYKDLNSIHFNGGGKLTGPVSTLPESLGKLELNENKEGSDGHMGFTKVFTADSPNPDYQYYCQVLSRDDHCFSINMKLKKK